jgi:hypothetical protein
VWNKVIEESFKVKIINFLGKKYGKEHNRSASHGTGGRAQKRYAIGKGRPNKSGIGQGAIGIKPRSQIEIIKGVRGEDANI